MAMNNAINANATTPLASAFGGTGVSNGVSTFTMGGNVEFSGAFPFVGVLTGSTNVTFPITGTLATLADIPAASGIVNVGSINQLAYYAANGDAVSGLATANNGVLVTNGSGVPSISATLPDGLAMGTPGSLTLTNATGLPISGITGLGTGVGSALAVNVGTAGAFVVNGGALGTPSSGTLTNTSGLVPSTGLAATGTPDNTTFLRGDNTWQTISSGSGTVNAGTANQLAYYAANGDAVSGLTGANSAMLVTNSSGVPAMTASMTDGQIIIGATSGTPAPATLTAGPGISISNAPNSITISGTGSGIGWTEVTGTTQAMAADNGYVANNAAPVVFTLPATAAFGTAIDVIGKGAGGWVVEQNAGQNIQIGNISSTVGATGSIESTNQYDSITLICTTADTTWTALGGPQSAGITIN